MKAAVLNAQPGPLEIEDILIDKPGPDEVLIQVKGAGLCHSDLHFMEGIFRTKLPASWRPSVRTSATSSRATM